MATETKTICDWCDRRGPPEQFKKAGQEIVLDFERGTIGVTIHDGSGADDGEEASDICERCWKGALRDAVKRLAIPRKKPAE